MCLWLVLACLVPWAQAVTHPHSHANLQTWLANTHNFQGAFYLHPGNQPPDKTP